MNQQEQRESEKMEEWPLTWSDMFQNKINFWMTREMILREVKHAVRHPENDLRPLCMLDENLKKFEQIDSHIMRLSKQ